VVTFGWVSTSALDVTQPRPAKQRAKSHPIKES
jgi:hypothetical protein